VGRAVRLVQEAGVSCTAPVDLHDPTYAASGNVRLRACPTCKGRERSARRRQDSAHREEMRRRAGERYERMRADAQAYAAMLEEARERDGEARRNTQGTAHPRKLDRARCWPSARSGRRLTPANLPSGPASRPMCSWSCSPRSAGAGGSGKTLAGGRPESDSLKRVISSCPLACASAR
jgi:hypothetical protein